MLKFIAIACVCFIAAEGSAAELRLRQEATPTASLVTLADVADVLAIDPVESDKLARTELFPAPPPGSSRLVRAGEIRDTLAQRGHDLRQIRFVGASFVRIHGASRGSAAVTVVPAVALEPSTNQSTAVVALRALRKGDVIRASDVQLQSVETPSAGAAVNIEDVVGQQVMRATALGSSIATADLQPPVLVQKNEIVTVYARTRGIQVRTSAKALQPGAKGEIIALESLLDRNAQFTARVVGNKEVEILAGPPMVTSPAAPRPQTSVRKSDSPQASLFGLRVRSSVNSPR
jgi:flagella basal body P-ring formation protein FlgA